MGFFVDPASCSCGGCEDYSRSAPAELPAPLTPIRTPKADVSMGPPALRRIAKDMGEDAFPSMALGRAPANQFWDGSDWVANDSVAALSTEASSSALPAPPALRHVDAFSSPAPAVQSSEEEMEDICERLRYVRADLQTQQENVYSADARSHGEMAAQDHEFDELDRKIMAIEQLLTAFGSFYRTR
jgi:hypothetical protein